jgi:alcohol dehydrogenase class IV
MNIFNIPPSIVVGKGATEQLASEIKKLGCSKALLVTDEFMVSSGTTGRFQKIIEEANLGFALLRNSVKA